MKRRSSALAFDHFKLKLQLFAAHDRAAVVFPHLARPTKAGGLLVEVDEPLNAEGFP